MLTRLRHPCVLEMVEPLQETRYDSWTISHGHPSWLILPNTGPLSLSLQSMSLDLLSQLYWLQVVRGP